MHQPIANPLLGMIIAKKCTSKVSVDGFPLWDQCFMPKASTAWPDIVVAGERFMGLPQAAGKLRIFADENTSFRFFDARGSALALGLICLLHALETIKLKPIAWSDVVLDFLNEKFA